MWGYEEIDVTYRDHYDFWALAAPKQLVVIELERSRHSVTLEDVHCLQRYNDNLSRSTDSEVAMALVSGLGWETSKERWVNQSGLRLLEWGAVYEEHQEFLPLLLGRA